METKQLLDSVSGTGVSGSYFIENDLVDTEVQAFINFVGGTVTLEASANDVDFAPLKDGQLTASQVVAIHLSEGSYLRVNYSGVTSGLTVFIKPKKLENNA